MLSRGEEYSEYHNQTRFLIITDNTVEYLQLKSQQMIAEAAHEIIQCRHLAVTAFHKTYPRHNDSALGYPSNFKWHNDYFSMDEAVDDNQTAKVSTLGSGFTVLQENLMRQESSCARKRWEPTETWRFVDACQRSLAEAPSRTPDYSTRSRTIHIKRATQEYLF